MSQPVSFQDAAGLVKLRLDILEIVGRHVSLKRAGRNYMGLCPFHQEKTPSFYVNPEKQMFKCFGCNEGGDTLSFLMKIEHKTYGELIQELADAYGIEIQQDAKKPSVSRSEIDLLIQLNQEAQVFYEQQLQRDENTKAYLESRAIGVSWQKHFGLGYAPAGWEHLVHHFQATVPAVQQSPMLMEKAGLANLRSEGQGFYDRFRHRLMIPIHDERGRVIAFGGRCLSEDDHPKYLNSPETPIYNKSRILYGFYQAKEQIRASGYAILMEGYFDVISAHMAGITQAVGVCGTALTENHLKLLQRTGVQTLYLCFDSDEAGQKAALRAIELIENQLLDQGVDAKVVLLPGEKDPDDFFKSQGQDRFQECLKEAQPFLIFKLNKALSGISDLHTPEGRIKASQQTVPLLAAIRQPVVRQEHIKFISERLKIAEETLILEVKRLEMQNGPYANKKNYEFQAISQPQDRYIGRKRRDTFRNPSRLEDISGFKKTLSEKIPVTQKEHLLLSYLLLNTESYGLVMSILPTIHFHSPEAIAFLEAVQSIEGTWQTMGELASALSHVFHSHANTPMLQFLADQAMTAEKLCEYYQSSEKGGHAIEYSERQKRDIEDIVARIQFLDAKETLSDMAQNVRAHEQQQDDQSALNSQLQLCEALRLKRPKVRRSLDHCAQNRFNPIEEQQGV